MSLPCAEPLVQTIHANSAAMPTTAPEEGSSKDEAQQSMVRMLRTHIQRTGERGLRPLLEKTLKRKGFELTRH